MDAPLFDRLERTGHILTSGNAQRVFGDLRTWHDKTFAGPALHIVVLTKRCNLNCTYCHMYPEFIGASKEQYDLKPEVADAIVRFALASPNPDITFEFQGGEPFLNFPMMKHFVAEVHRQNARVGKKVSFAVTSNVMLLEDEHMEFCREQGVVISYSLNGPEHLHDRFRITRNGAGSFAAVMKKLESLRGRYPGMLNAAPLCVVTSENAPRLREMIEWYHEAGFSGIAIIMLKNLGNTRTNKLAFDMRAFLPHYLGALDYLYDKNRRLGRAYSERLLRVALFKILSRSGVGYVDWRNPCGDFGGSVTYDYDGTVLPSDEARSLRPAFDVGHVLKDTYEDVVRREKTFSTMNLSLRDRDPECRECAFNPYCGVLPILEYARSGSAVPRPHETDECLFTLAILDWTFARLMEDPLPLVRMLPGMDEALVARAVALRPRTEAPLLEAQTP
jgi:radical SAM protein with 4Fe4S-binding SPASM domain